MDVLDKLVNVELNWSLLKGIGLVLHAFDNNNELAVLIIQGVFSSKAEGRFGQNSWKFKRAGLLQNNISITEGDSNQETAMFKKKGLGGILTMKDGKSYLIERNALMTEYKLLSNQEPVIKYIFDQHSKFFLQPASVGLQHLPLLLVFLPYLIIMQRIDYKSAIPF